MVVEVSLQFICYQLVVYLEIISQIIMSVYWVYWSSQSTNKTLGMISGTYMYKDKVTNFQLYKSLVRPKLEYYFQVWRP